MSKSASIRFHFIEQVIWWEGQINASHLIDKYNITRTQASHILKEYRHTHPNNLYYDQSAKAYLITPIRGRYERSEAQQKRPTCKVKNTV